MEKSDLDKALESAGAAKYKFSKELVRYKSEGEEIEAILLKPEGFSGRPPVVVMAGGFCYVKEFITPLQMYAEAFAAAGIAVLAFDYRGFGGSGGALRQHVDPWMQIQDYRNSISYLETREDVDAERVGVWGISYSGGHVLILSAIDDRIKANVGVVPVIDGLPTMKMAHGTLAFRTLKNHVAEARRKRYATGEHAYMPMNGSTSGKATVWAFPASSDMFAWLSKEANINTYEDRCTVESAELLMQYSVYPHVTRILDTPTMMVVAEKDDHTFWEQEIEAFNAVPTHKKNLRVVEGRGRGHHELYRNPERIGEVARECAGWFMRWL
jgi:uncharacterized protein